MIGFDRARAIAVSAVEGSWPRTNGTLYASMDGFEDESDWIVVLGAEEWLVDEDPSFIILDSPLVVVNKKTGRYRISTYLDDPARFDRTTPVSTS